MLIKKIDLINFRQFSGSNTIDFATDSEKNITIVMGDNGAGKTTLAQAFLWCLYGETDFKVKELINRDVRDSLKIDGKEEVRVKLYVSRGGKDYYISRSQKLIKDVRTIKSQGVEFFVAEKNKENGEWEFNMTENQSRIFIKKIIPKELSKFFFFDGERIKNMSDEIERGKSKDFADAVRGLVGLTAMMNAINHFKPSTTNGTVLGKINNKIDSIGDSKLRELTEKLNEIDCNVEKWEKRIEEIEPSIDYYEEEAIRKKEELMSLSDAIEMKDRHNKLVKGIKVLESEKAKFIESTLKAFSSDALNFFSKPLVDDTLRELKETDKLDKGIPKMHADTVNFLLERGFCICGSSLTHGSKEVKALYDLLDVIPPKTIGQSIGQFVDSSKNRIRSSEAFFSNIDSSYKSVRRTCDEIEKKEIEMTEIEANISDTSKAKELKEKHAEFKYKAKSLKSELNELNKKLGQVEANKGYIEAEKDKLIIQDEKNKKNRVLYEYAKYIYEDLLSSYKDKEVTVREELQNSINEVFQEIYDGGIVLEINDKYNIKVMVQGISSSEDELERNTAQNYAIIFAFISGIIKMAKENSVKPNVLESLTNSEEVSEGDPDGYPLVMDAPLSAFDKRRINNICDTIPGIAQQVIMFIKDTDGDVAEEHLGNKIGSKWALSAATKTQTSIERR